METTAVYENFKATELRLGLPGRDESESKSNNKRSSSEMDHQTGQETGAPAPK